MKRFVLSVVLVCLWGMGMHVLPSSAYAIALDLNDFYLEGDGSIEPDGASARLDVLDPDYGYTLLVNDPLWGDPGIDVGTDALSISFDYEFFEPTANDTELFVRLFDGDSGSLIDTFLVDVSSAGNHTFDLSTLAATQTLLGMDFTITEYNSGSSGFNPGSWVTISNLDLAVLESTPVPEPGTLMLLGTGLVALCGGMRRKKIR